MINSIRVCIGTEPRATVPTRVLEFSIVSNLLKKNARVEFYPLMGGDWKDTGPLRQYTGFSLLRWTIPEKFGHQGKAIYLDADQLCLADIGELWDVDQQNSSDSCVHCTTVVFRPRRLLFPLIRRRVPLPESSVMLIDCEKAKGRLRTSSQIESLIEANGKQAYEEIMHLKYLSPPPDEVSSWWNVMDGRGRGADSFSDPRARILHYTRIPTQPWYFPDHPARGIWERYLQNALDAGHLRREEIQEACDRFSVKGGRPDGMHPYWKKYTEICRSG